MEARVTKTDVNLWIAFSDEAKANRLYSAYAWAALNEGYPQAAQAFMEAAGSEAIHALTMLAPLGAIKTTADNLRHVILEEAKESESNYPRYIEEAQAEGRPDAVAVFQLALDRERYHITLFQDILGGLTKVKASPATDGQSRAVGAQASRPAQPRPLPQQGKLHGPPELRTERERIASRSRIREVVFGAQDGVLTTVSVVSAFYGATHSKSDILLAGLASGFAGMVAMSAGSYLSSKAEAEVGHAEIASEAREIAERPAEELAELVEIYRQQGMPLAQARAAAHEVAKDPKKLLRVMAREELGLDIEPKENPLKNAGVMALSFLSGAIFPILPYTLLQGRLAFWSSIFLAAAVLFGVGVVKARVADTNQWKSGMETFVIGTVAGLLGYVFGTLIPRYFGITFTG